VSVRAADVDMRVRRGLMDFARIPVPGQPPRPVRARPLDSVVVDNFSANCLRSERSVASRRRHARAVVLLHRAGIDLRARGIAWEKTVAPALRAHGLGIEVETLRKFTGRNPDFAALAIAGATKRARDSQAPKTGMPPS
jgi:hypothetical protein